MASHTHRFGKARVEVGAISHAGRTYSARGSVDPERGVLVGYVKKVAEEDLQPGDSRHVLTSWDGKKVLANLRKVSTWKTPRSQWSSTISAWSADGGGRHYVGRCAGDDMLLKMGATRGKR